MILMIIQRHVWYWSRENGVDTEVSDDGIIEQSRTVCIRTKNGRVRKAKVPKTVKIRNSRQQNKRCGEDSVRVAIEKCSVWHAKSAAWV